MTRARVAVHASFTFGLTLLGFGCPTTYVSLGDTKSNDRGAAGDVGGTGGAAGMGSVADTGVAGRYDAVAGSGGTIVIGACSPTEQTLSDCAPYQQMNDVYNHNACLNRGDGVDGMAADQCEGYAPCSYQHEGCVFHYSSGAAGAGNTGCAGSPAEEAWLMDCGGQGFYGPDILSGTAGQAGCGGVAGAAGITGGMGGAGGVVGGNGAGMGGVGGTTGGSGGMAGMTIGGAGGAGGMSGTGGVGGAAGASGAAGLTGGEGGGG